MQSPALMGGSGKRSTALSTRLLIVLCLLAGLILPLGCAAEKLPATASELLRASGLADEYLTRQGKRLEDGRTIGATMYSVDARLDTRRNSVSGSELFVYTNRSGVPLTEVVLRVYANDPGIAVAGSPVSISDARVEGRAAEYSLEGSFLKLSIPGGLEPGKSTSFSFDFDEPVPQSDASGSGGVYGYSDGTYSLGNFLPTVALCPGGTWDTRETPTDGDVCYYDCSDYFVSFEAPEGYMVAATGVETSRSGNTHLYVAGSARDFEVQASRRYASASRRVGPTTVTSYFYRGDSRGGAKALDYGCDTLSQFGRHFGPYPYRRLNICEMPMEDYGMEFTGQVQIADWLYEDLSRNAEDLELTIAHEICHQWWALGVGSDSIGHPWQDESLTSFCEVLYTGWQHGPAEAEKLLEDELVGGYEEMREDDVAEAAVDLPVSGFVEDEYTLAVYTKGAILFDELSGLIGDQRLEEGLRDYYMDHLFLNATREDMQAAFSSRSDGLADVNALFKRWLDELHGDEDIYPPG